MSEPKPYYHLAYQTSVLMRHARELIRLQETLNKNLSPSTPGLAEYLQVQLATEQAITHAQKIMSEQEEQP